MTHRLLFHMKYLYYCIYEADGENIYYLTKHNGSLLY